MTKLSSTYPDGRLGGDEVIYAAGDTPHERAWWDMQRQVGDMQETYRERREQRELINRAFARNLQSQVEEVDWLDDASTDEDVFDPFPRGMNIIAPLVRAATAEKLAMRPNIQLSSSQSDLGTRTKADMMTRIARGWLRNGVIDMEEVRRCTFDSESVGLAFIKCFWDPMGGKPIKPTESADYGTDPFGAPVPPSLFEGEIGTMFVPTNDGLPSPNARRWSEVREFAHIRLMPIRQVADMFETDHFGQPINVRGLSLHRSEFTAQERFREVQQDDFSSNLQMEASSNELVAFHEFWELPSREFPNGRFAQWCGQVLFYIGPNPLVPRRIPFVPFYGENIVPGSLYADGTVEYQKALQSDVNMTARKKREWLDLVTNGRITVPFNSAVDKNAFQNRSGTVIEYRMGHKPEVMPVADIPQSMFTHEASRIELANFLAGHDEVSRGQLPSGGKDISGRAIAYITEQEQKNRTPNLTAYVKSIYSVVQHCMWLARQFYQDGRHTKMLGENKAWQWEVLRVDELDMDAEIVFDLQSSIAPTPSVRFNTALDLFATGGLDETPAAERLRGLLGEEYESGPEADEREIDREKARRHLMLIKQNPWAQLNPSTADDPIEHLKVYNRFRKTPEFEQLAPEQAERVMELVEAYEQLDAWQQLEAAQLQEAQGAPLAPPNMEQFGGGVPPPGPPQAGVLDSGGGASPAPPRPSPSAGGAQSFDPSVTAAEQAGSTGAV